MKTINTIKFNSIDSTSIYLRNNIYAEDTLIIAKKQTKGKGRTGKSFYSPKGGIYFSLSLHNVDSSLLTLKVAVAINRVLNKLYNINTSIKWVNDIFYNNLKLGGILVEQVNDFYIVGIGININNNINKIKDIATSIKINNFDSDLFILSIVHELYSIIDNKENILEEYKNKMFLLNKEISFKYDNQLLSGIIKNINEEGNLIVNVNDKEIILNNGEVSILGK